MYYNFNVKKINGRLRIYKQNKPSTNTSTNTSTCMFFLISAPILHPTPGYHYAKYSVHLLFLYDFSSHLVSAIT